jgi:glycosyltransferase involved in cell wall biosynthesis
MHVLIVIPALNEAATIASVVEQLIRAVPDGVVGTVVVADNGSTDATAQEAQAAGAVVVREPVRGYGKACLAALATSSFGHDVVLFADGDGADDAGDVPAMLQPLVAAQADLVIGSRVLGSKRGWVERGALTPAQRVGNKLATSLLAAAYRQPATDLGPFRAIRSAALARLHMDDVDFGWTVQMQARAARVGLRTVEVPVHYRKRRAGRSKVSGDLRASIVAGGVILSTLWRERHFNAETPN